MSRSKKHDIVGLCAVVNQYGIEKTAIYCGYNLQYLKKRLKNEAIKIWEPIGVKNEK